MPLPGTRVIHPLWSETHRPVVTGVMTSECSVTRADGAGTTDDDGTWHTGTRMVIYSGPCRVTRIAAEDDHPVTGEERLSVRRYSVQITADAAEILTGDSVEITSSNDPVMTGRKLRIEGIVIGSEVWSRNMVAVEFEEGI